MASGRDKNFICYNHVLSSLPPSCDLYITILVLISSFQIILLVTIYLLATFLYQGEASLVSSIKRISNDRSIASTPLNNVRGS